MTAYDLMGAVEGLEASALETLRGADKTGEGVQLPFPVANIWWHNGDARQKTDAKDCPPLYFGGWATDQGKLQELVDSEAVPGPLSKWSAFEGSGDKGSWQGLAARSLTFATLAHRKRWIGQDGKAGPDYDAAAGLTRQHMQTLALAYIDAKPWGYVVLTTKGFQVKYFNEAVAAWRKAIAPFRKELNAPETMFPVSAFAITVGTLGAEPVFESVGRSSQSKITPIRALVPDTLDAKAVNGRFIGPNNLRAAAEAVNQAAEWLAAWKKGADAPGANRDAAREEPEQELPF
jgi:hypothetical protein